MSGGVWEVVAGAVDNNRFRTNANYASLHANRRYVDIYAQYAHSAESAQNNYNANSHIFGNAIWETSIGGSGTTGSWFGANATFPNAGGSVFIRGGHSSLSTAGMFHFDTGSGNNPVGFRIVVVPN